jgi:hypothetical protein
MLHRSAFKGGYCRFVTFEGERILVLSLTYEVAV